ncbi:MAG: hypothetical protein N4A38_03205 [Candidatus Gracilibacteria bacterium]|nr:hypothetical protein [Candidatus Gracilibacteria bacterium]
MNAEATKQFDIKIDTDGNNSLSKQEFGDILTFLKRPERGDEKFAEKSNFRDDFKNNIRETFSSNGELKASLQKNIISAFDSGGLSDEQVSSAAVAYYLVFGEQFKYEGIEIANLTPEQAFENFIENKNIPEETKKGYLSFLTDVLAGKSSVVDLGDFKGTLDYQELKELRKTIDENISKINKLGSYEKFKQVIGEIDGDINFFRLPENATPDFINKLCNISERDAQILLKKKTGEDGFDMGVIYGLARVMLKQAETTVYLLDDLARLKQDLKLLNFNSFIMQYYDYSSQNTPEAQMKLEALVKAHPVLGMIQIAENPKEAIKKLQNAINNSDGLTAETTANILSIFVVGAGTKVGKVGGQVVQKTTKEIKNAARVTRQMAQPKLVPAYATVSSETGIVGGVGANLADDLTNGGLTYKTALKGGTAEAAAAQEAGKAIEKAKARTVKTSPKEPQKPATNTDKAPTKPSQESGKTAGTENTPKPTSKKETTAANVDKNGTTQPSGETVKNTGTNTRERVPAKSREGVPNEGNKAPTEIPQMVGQFRLLKLSDKGEILKKMKFGPAMENMNKFYDKMEDIVVLNSLSNKPMMDGFKEIVAGQYRYMKSLDLSKLSLGQLEQLQEIMNYGMVRTMRRLGAEPIKKGKFQNIAEYLGLKKSQVTELKTTTEMTRFAKNFLENTKRRAFREKLSQAVNNARKANKK